VGFFRDVVRDAGQAWSGQIRAEHAPAFHFLQPGLPPNAAQTPAGLDFLGNERHTESNDSREGRRVPSDGSLPAEQHVVGEARRSTSERSSNAKSDVDGTMTARGNPVPVFGRGSEPSYAFGNAERIVTVKRQARKDGDAGPPSWNSNRASPASFEFLAGDPRTPQPFIAAMRPEGLPVASPGATALAESSRGSAQEFVTTATTRSPTPTETTSVTAVTQPDSSLRIACVASRLDSAGLLPEGVPSAASWPGAAPSVGNGGAGTRHGHGAEARLQDRAAAAAPAHKYLSHDDISETASKRRADEDGIAALAWVREPPAPMKWNAPDVEPGERNPEVNIGVIEVIVESPRESSRSAAQAAPSTGSASRFYLRGL